MSWLSVEGSLRRYRSLRADGWRPVLLPIGSDGAGNHLCVDLRTGGVCLFDHEAFVPVVSIASSLGDWMHELAGAMERGEVGYDHAAQGLFRAEAEVRAAASVRWTATMTGHPSCRSGRPRRPAA